MSQQKNTESNERAAFTRGLREIADWLDSHPEVPLPYLGAYAEGSNLPSMPIWLHSGGSARAQMATIVRAMATDGAKVQKRAKDSTNSFQVWREFGGGVVVLASADREEVCERVVVATREVTTQVPDPDAVAALPTVAVTTVVEDVEWRCMPILADLPGGAR